jgi:hypothetical protein
MGIIEIVHYHKLLVRYCKVSVRLVTLFCLKVIYRVFGFQVIHSLIQHRDNIIFKVFTDFHDIMDYVIQQKQNFAPIMQMSVTHLIEKL